MENTFFEVHFFDRLFFDQNFRAKFVDRLIFIFEFQHQLMNLSNVQSHIQVSSGVLKSILANYLFFAVVQIDLKLLFDFLNLTKKYYLYMNAINQ